LYLVEKSVKKRRKENRNRNNHDDEGKKEVKPNM
jgi:hypothetical protein